VNDTNYNDISVNLFAKYKDILKNNKMYQQYLQKKTNINCLSCSSVLCKNNWKNTHTYNIIIIELINNLKAKQWINKVLHLPIECYL
jgi:hypothetical protein